MSRIAGLLERNPTPAGMAEFPRSRASDPLRPEDDALLCCARTRLDAGRAERLRALLREELDWLSLVETALWHGLHPLLYWHLDALAAEVVPPAWKEFLRLSFEENVRRNLALTAQLFRILEAFQANGILGVPYKGPVLAWLAYGNLGLREFLDLDLMVRSQDVPKASELLVSQGYRPEFELPPARAASAQRIPGQYMFSRGGNGDIVELHTPLTLRYYPVPLDLERLSQRLRPVSLAGREVWTFSTEDSLSILCVHSSKHFWERLKWVCDIAELVQNPEGVNWGQAEEQARRLGCERMLFLGLCLANDLLDAPLPEEVLRRLKANRAVESLAAQIRGQLFAHARELPGVMQRLFFRFRMREGLWDGLRYCLRLALTPTEEDWKFLRLPAPLAPLYSVLRPLRLVRTHGWGLLRRPAPELPARPACREKRTE